MPRHLDDDIGERPRRIFSRDREQCVLRRSRIAIDQIHDRARMRSDDGGVRSGGEVADRRRVPVIAAGEPAGFVHPCCTTAQSPSLVSTNECR